MLTMFVLIMACKDDSLDPFRLQEIKKGSLLALRANDGTQGTINVNQNFFLKDNILGTETFSYVADFISEDQSLLESVEVYARILTGPRSRVATVAGSGFVSPAEGRPRQGRVSVSLSTILTTLNVSPASLNRTDLIIESDIILTDGSTVPASAMTNPGLFAANAFFPAHSLNYLAERSSDFVPIATLKMAGEVVKSSTGAITRPVFPLRAGAKDTVFATYDQDITNTPTFAYSNQATTSAAVGVTGSGVVKKSARVFYEIVTASPGFTGAVTATVSGATANTYGLPLAQVARTQTINVDNTAPVRTATSTGTRIGRGQFVTISVTFNEALSNKAADRIKITIDDPNDKLKEVTGQEMTVAANGLSASYLFLFEEINPANPAIHGPLTISFTDGRDLAGNATVIPNASLTVDVNKPPAPSVQPLPSPYDLGTQIRWAWTQGTGPGNPGGSTTGTIYWVAVNKAHSADPQTPAPLNVTFDADANATWVMDTDPNSTANPKDKVAIRQQGTITVTGGNSGTSGLLTTIFSTFTANRKFLDDRKNADPLDDETLGMSIYAVFVGSTGNVSAITAAPIPGLENIIME